MNETLRISAAAADTERSSSDLPVTAAADAAAVTAGRFSARAAPSSCVSALSALSTGLGEALVGCVGDRLGLWLECACLRLSGRPGLRLRLMLGWGKPRGLICSCDEPAAVAAVAVRVCRRGGGTMRAELIRALVAAVALPTVDSATVAGLLAFTIVASGTRTELVDAEGGFAGGKSVWSDPSDEG